MCRFSRLKTGVLTASRRAWTGVDYPMLELTGSDGLARAGSLQLSGHCVELPAMLLYTKRGSTLNLTPDLARPLGPGKHVDVTQLYVQSANSSSFCDFVLDSGNTH